MEFNSEVSGYKHNFQLFTVQHDQSTHSFSDSTLPYWSCIEQSPGTLSPPQDTQPCLLGVRRRGGSVSKHLTRYTLVAEQAWT